MQKFLATKITLLITLFVSLSSFDLTAQPHTNLRSNDTEQLDKLLETMDPEDRVSFITLLDGMTHDSETNKAFVDKVFEKVGVLIQAFPYAKVPGFAVRLGLAIFFWEYGNQIADKVFPGSLTTSKSEFVKLLMGVLLIEDIKDFIKAIKNLDNKKEEKPEPITKEEIKTLVENALKELHALINETQAPQSQVLIA